MSERSGVIEFPHVSYNNPHFRRAYGAMWAIEDIDAAQAAAITQRVGYFTFASEEFFDKNEIVTITMFGNEPYKSERPNAIYKIPEHSRGRPYLREKNRGPSLLLQPVWVEDFSSAPPELSKLLQTIEEVCGFGSGELIDITQAEQPSIQQHLITPHLSQTVRKMIGLSRQQVSSNEQ